MSSTTVAWKEAGYNDSLNFDLTSTYEMERPTKRPRPDGFEKPRSAYKPPETINTFISTSAKPTSRDSKKPALKTTRVELPQNQFGNVVPEESKPRVSSRRLNTAALGHRSLQVGSDEKERVALKHLKSPVLAHVVPVEDKPPAKASTSIMSLQPMMPPPTTPEKPKSVRKPPPFPKKSVVPLKPLALAPPALPQLPVPPQKTMKTILTTSVAQAIDPTKEGTGAELLALFLQQHGHDFTSSVDRDLYRGIMLSPDKRSRGKHTKFIRQVSFPTRQHDLLIAPYFRGGLAERAQQHISCEQTDFVLWRRQVEQKIESGMKIASDVQLHILRILHVLRSPEKPHSAPVTRCALAICRIKRQHKFAASELTAGVCLVLFTFPPTHGSVSAISSPQQFGEDRDVSVWMPWQKIDVSDVGDGEIQGIVSGLDDLGPPRILLVVSRFYVLVPKQPD